MVRPMLRELRHVFPLIAAVITALCAYWALRNGFDVEPTYIFNGGVIGAAFVGAAYFGVRR